MQEHTRRQNHIRSREVGYEGYGMHEFVYNGLRTLARVTRSTFGSAVIPSPYIEYAALSAAFQRDIRFCGLDFREFHP